MEQFNKLSVSLLFIFNVSLISTRRIMYENVVFDVP